MRKMGVLVIFAIAIWCFSGVFSDDGTELDCNNFRRVKGRGGIACTRMWRPVCGTDDITYSNPCMLCNENLKLGRYIGKKHDGECVKDFCKKFSPNTPMCTMDYIPHCGSDGKTYGNKCLFCFKALNSAEPLFLSHMGKCEKLE